MVKILLTLMCLKSYAQVFRHFKNQEKPKYELGIGTAFLDTPNYPGSSGNSSRVLAIPTFIYRGEVLRSDEEGTRAKIISSENFELGVSGGFNFPIKSDENSSRSGMPDTDALLGFGPGVIFRLIKEDLYRLNFSVGFRANFSTDLEKRFEYQGILVEPALKFWGQRSKFSRFTFFSSFSLSFSDQKYADFFYTVPAEFSTATREAYSSRDGLIDIALSAGSSVDLGPDASLFLGGFYSNYRYAANRESDLLSDDDNSGLILGLVWFLWESDEMVRGR